MEIIKKIKINGEDIVTRKGHRDISTMAEARNAAKRISSSKNHSWANIYFLNRDKKVIRETWLEGKPYIIFGGFSGDKEGANFWFTAKKTVKEAMDF